MISTERELQPIKTTYRGYEVEVTPDGGGQYISARPFKSHLPIPSRTRMKVLCSPERAFDIVKAAIDRLLKG